MILSAHQPSYLPWAGYFDKIAQADLFCHFDMVQYERGSFQNRNRIKIKKGKVKWITAPVFVPSYEGATIQDIRIAPGNWKRKTIELIKHAYAKAPFLNLYLREIAVILSQDHIRLMDMNAAFVKYFMHCLDIRTPVVSAHEHGFEGKKSDLVLDMCKKLGATTYIFGAQGRNYADIASFEAAGIKTVFQDYKTEPYPQLHGREFVPDLSILDMLMCIGPAAAERFKKK